MKCAKMMKDRMAQAERECLSEIAAQKKGARMTQAQLSHALTDSLLKKKSTKNNKESQSTATPSKPASDSSDKAATNLNDICSEGQGLRRSPRKDVSIVATPSKTASDSNDKADTNLNDTCSKGQELRRSPRKVPSKKATSSKTYTDLKANSGKTYCLDEVAHIATDMMQIQNVPKVKVGVAWYKSKVSNEIIITKNIKQFNSD